MQHALIVLLLLLSPIQPQNQDSASAMARNPEVLGFFGELIKRSGSRHTESAAFLLRDAAGHYDCVAWAFSNRHEEQRFQGAVPPSTVAIAHTHPFHAPQPSQADVRTAVALGGPVFVVTPASIQAALPDGAIVRIITDHAWKSPGAHGRCSRAAR